jgi:hypothetical protein
LLFGVVIFVSIGALIGDDTGGIIPGSITAVVHKKNNEHNINSIDILNKRN